MTAASSPTARPADPRRWPPALRAAGLFVAAVVLVQVSWNMFAPDLFGLPEMRSRQALGLTVFAGLAAMLPRLALGHGRHG